MQEILVITGPTGSGKTQLALDLAQYIPLEVVSADASMVYRGMDIGTAKPSRAEREKVPHHLIDICDPSDSFSIGSYLPQAEKCIQSIIDQHRTPVVVGGTGYYIRALSEGVYDLPEPDLDLQNKIWEELKNAGLDPLLRELKAASPQDYIRAEKNPRRVVRALEIIRKHKVLPVNLQKSIPEFNYRKIVLWPNMSQLEASLAQRVDSMFQAGLVEEVETLLTRYKEIPTAFQSIGYKEIASHLRGEISLQESISLIKKSTWAYAKRQITWFKKEPGAIMVECSNPLTSQDRDRLLAQIIS